jgi:hypothetical protein
VAAIFEGVTDQHRRHRRLSKKCEAIHDAPYLPTPTRHRAPSAAKDTTVTLQDGLKTSERKGKPISGKFEIEDDALQLSVYTLKGDDFIEVVADPKTGTVAKAKKLTDAVDLNDAESQKAAMAKAKVTLVTAADTAVKANPGCQAVSIYPQLQNGHAVAEVTLLQGTTFKKVTEKLD